jgi:aspartate kinase
MKFGGTSVGNATAIAALADITREQLVVWDRAVVVVSAMSGVTDMLIQGAQTAASGDAATYKAIAIRLREKHAAALAELVPAPAEVAATRAPIEQLIDEFELLCHSVHVLGEVSPRALDAISGLGERMCARLVAAAMRARGLPAEAVDARKAHRIRQLAGAWLAAHHVPWVEVRYDVLAVLVEPGSAARVHHYEAAF